MRASDLMIGDYVTVTPSGMLIQVAATHKRKVAYHACTDKLSWVREGLLRPIPLTREILEKNGFEYCEVHRMYLYLDDFFDIKIRQYSDMMWEFTYCNNEMNLPDTQIAGIGYVHHLQHALNMVGVEKDIII